MVANFGQVPIPNTRLHTDGFKVRVKGDLDLAIFMNVDSTWW